MGMQEQSLFIAALEIDDPAERAAFLDRACASDPALRQRIERLLERHQESGSFLDSPGPELETTINEPGRERPGTVVGPYKLLEQIGEGGMGLVFVAEQSHPVRRQVALKLVKPGMDTRQVLARFEQERQALALMDHPNIAKVLDGGDTDSGRPYFVMELVKGVPITRFCDDARLAPRERLGLFLQVCAAVQHAHQKGVIHRDVKPSNVLVAVHDRVPMAKVIDFGVAKALGQELTDRTLYTGFAQMLGTPLYMSPEQAGQSGLDVDTRSDIYSLGVLLYELLTGTTPFDRERFRAVGFDEIRHIIREEEPPRPSTRVGTLGPAAATLSANRRSDPRRLSQLLRGELDWIVMKCLEKDRDRRYETANGLALDVERYLADEPVAAGPPSAGYRLRKFAWRHRGPVLAASVILLSLVGGVVGTTLGLFEARRHEQAAVRSAEQEKNAHAAAVESEADTRAFADFLANYVLAATRPEGVQGGVGRNVTMEEALVKAEPKLGDVFRDRPRAEALARHEIGVTWRNLGKYAQAERHLRRALELRQQQFGADAAETIASLNSLGVTLTQAGRAPEAIPLLERALKSLEATRGPDHTDTLRTMNNLAGAYLEAGEPGRALRLFEESLERQRATLGPDHPHTLMGMHNVASTCRDAGNRDRALPLLEEALAKQKATLRPDHPDTLGTMNTLALVYQDAGKLRRALALLEEALAKQRATLGLDHPDTLRTMNNLATAHREAGKLDRAVPLLEEALEKHRTTLGPDHPHTLLIMINLAGAYQDAGQLGRALPIFEEVLEKQKTKLPPDHPHTLSSMNALARAYQAAGKPDRAVPLLVEAQAKQKARLGPDHPHTLSSMKHLGLAYQAAGKLDLALPLLEEALERRKATLGPDHPDTLTTMNNLALAYRDAGKLGRALPLLEEALERRKATLGPDDRQTLASMNSLGGAYRDAGKPDRAVPLLEEALAKQKATLGPDHPDTLASMNNLALAYKDAGKFDLALPLLEESLERHKARLGPDHPDTLTSMNNLAGAYQDAGQHGRALPMFEEVLKKQRASLGRDHPDTLSTMNFLALAYVAAGKLDLAVPLLEETLEQRKARLPPDHPDTLISTFNLAYVLRDTGKLDRAVPLFETAVGGWRRNFGLRHPRTRSFIAALADCHERMKNPAQAEPLRRELADFARQQAGADSLQYAGHLALLGSNLLQQKKFADAESALRESLAIRETREPDAWTTSNTRSSLGGALLGQKKYADAEPLLLAGYEGMRQRQAKIPPVGRGRLTDALERLVQLYDDLGKQDKAAEWRTKLEARRQAEAKSVK
jgi:serine/threonine protein kinase/tetratricopeptide (TPR) repeat protein